MSLDTRALRTAIVTALRADAGVAAFVGPRVYNDVPADTVFPFISLVTGDESDWSTDATQGSDFRIQIDCWSRAAGQSETDNILSAIHSCLHLASLSVAGSSLVLLRFTQALVTRDSDGETYHGVAQFHALTDRN